MSTFDKVQNRIARILWEKCDSINDQKVRAPWRTAEWMELASRVMKEVLAEADAIKAEPKPKIRGFQP